MSDLIDRQAVIDLLKQMRKDGDMVPWEGKNVFARIRMLPALHLEECTEKRMETHACDCISRQAAISAICNACGKIDCDKMDKCKKLQLPPANCSEFPNNSDTISRQAAIDALAEWEATRVWDDWCYDHKNEAEKYHITAPSAVVKALPPAQPHTDAEIQKMQELVAVQIEKAYELGRESAQSEQRWIPCSERLPEAKQRVLVTFPDGTVDIKICIDAGHLKWFLLTWSHGCRCQNRMQKGEPMSKCGDCKYAEGSNYKISNIECCTCSLTRRVMNANAESNCNCFNRDLSEYDICYNCKYYIGGGDWGLFCSHEDMYHHLGKFSDAPCKRYERRTECD